VTFGHFERDIFLCELPEFQTRWYDSMLGIAADDGYSESYFRSPLLALLEEIGTFAVVIQVDDDYHVPNREKLEGNFQFLMLGKRDIRTRYKGESVEGPQNSPKKESPNLKMLELQDAIPVPDDPDQHSHCS
jgi:hypothetical protein